MTASLEGQHVIVTGGGAGIGLASVRACIAAGARVTALDVNAGAEAPLRDAGAHFRQCDVARPEDLAKAIGDARKDEGRLDGLINNAGITIAEPFLEARWDVFETLWQVNQRSVLVGCQTAARIMVADDTKGVIVNMSSVHTRSSDAGFEAYAGTKGAIAAMTRAMAWSLGRHGIRVNALCPGLTITESIEASIDAATRTHFEGWHATGEVNSPEDVGRIAAFLLSEAGAAFSGADLIADRGMSARLGGDPFV